MATDWKKFEQNNKTIEKYDGEKYNYLALKSITAADGFNRPIRSLSRLLCGITSNHNGDFYCLGCFHSFCCNDSLKKHERFCGKHDYFDVETPKGDKKILKYRHGGKSLKAPFIVHVDLECLLIKEQSCQNNSEKSYTERKAKHEASGYSLSLVFLFVKTKNRHYFYRGKDCIENFCEKLKEIATEIINYEK